MAMMMGQWCAAVARRVMVRELTTMSSFGVPMLCGRGDKKTKKGKRFKGTYGNARPRKEKMIERIKDKVEVIRTEMMFRSMPTDPSIRRFDSNETCPQSIKNKTYKCDPHIPPPKTKA